MATDHNVRQGGRQGRPEIKIRFSSPWPVELQRQDLADFIAAFTSFTSALRYRCPRPVQCPVPGPETEKRTRVWTGPTRCCMGRPNSELGATQQRVEPLACIGQTGSYTAAECIGEAIAVQAWGFRKTSLSKFVSLGAPQRTVQFVT